MQQRDTYRHVRRSATDKKNGVKRIIIVDDDKAILGALTIALERAGYFVKTRMTSKDLYRDLREKAPPHAILLDYLLSGENGAEVIRKIRSDPDTAEIPVIVISAHPSAEKHVRDAGAEDFVSKPFSIKSLITAIEEVSRSPSVSRSRE